MQKLETSLRKSLEGCRRLAVLGIGSELCADDAAGILLVRQLCSRISAQPLGTLEYEGFEGGNAPENATGFIAAFQPTHILMVDAAEIGTPVGSCREISPAEIPEVCFSTHTLPLKIIIDYLGKATGAVISVIGIQPGNLDFGNRPTPEVRNGVRRLMRLLHKVMGECDGEAPRISRSGSANL
ncbi:MAG: hydrogenase 3 maturation endopeptidase HyCI [Desulfuromonadales bacterium]|nr:hydrogenase 3 maturation endopeptidase HyCI [Desulfuromonadales bacterium]